MNKFRTARLVSDELVVTEAENNQASVDLIPAFAQGIVNIKSNNTQIRAAMTLQEQSIGGVTTEKSNAHELLVDYTIDMAGGIHSYAESKNDTVLQAKADLANAEIEHQGFSQLINTATGIQQLASGIAPADLAYFGISADEVTAFGAALTTFTTLKTSPKEASIEHTKLTNTIVALQADSQQILNMQDKLATQFKRKAPAYYEVYLTSRKNSLASPRKKKEVADNTAAENTTNKATDVK